MSAHRFRVGQTVVVPWSGPQVGIRPGPYVIVRLLPMEDGEPHYRVRSSADGHERALLESQIKAREERPAKVEAPAVSPGATAQVKEGSARRLVQICGAITAVSTSRTADVIKGSG